MNVLIVRTSALGDVVHCLPVLAGERAILVENLFVEVPGLVERAGGQRRLDPSHDPRGSAGDRHLLRLSGWGGIQVLTPRQFVEQHLHR